MPYTCVNDVKLTREAYDHQTVTRVIASSMKYIENNFIEKVKQKVYIFNKIQRNKKKEKKFKTREHRALKNNKVIL